MKGKVKNICTFGLITACIFVIFALVYEAFVGYVLVYDGENKINDSTELFKQYGEIFEEKIEGYTGEAKVIEEGKIVFSLMYARQAQMATHLLLILFVGMIIGAGIGYVNATQDISKSNGKKMFVMYAIGVLILILMCYLYNNITGNAEPDIKTAIITSSQPVLIYSLIYILSILYKIIENKKKKDVLNELLKDCKSK